MVISGIFLYATSAAECFSLSATWSTQTQPRIKPETTLAGPGSLFCQKQKGYPLKSWIIQPVVIGLKTQNTETEGFSSLFFFSYYFWFPVCECSHISHCFLQLHQLLSSQIISRLAKYSDLIHRVSHVFQISTEKSLNVLLKQYFSVLLLEIRGSIFVM